MQALWRVALRGHERVGRRFLNEIVEDARQTFIRSMATFVGALLQRTYVSHSNSDYFVIASIDDYCARGEMDVDEEAMGALRAS